MKKIFFTSLLALALVGCGSKETTESEKKESTITPQTSEVSAQSTPNNAATNNAQLTEMYGRIHQGIYILKESKDPNLDQVLDKIELYGADNNLDAKEAHEILSMIQLHAASLKPMGGNTTNQGAPTEQAPQGQPSVTKEDLNSGISNPNPFAQ